MQATTQAATASQSTQLARGTIGFWEALAMSVEAMGPLLGALSVAPLIALFAGFSAPFIVLVAGIAMFAVALTIGRFSRALPSAASTLLMIGLGLYAQAAFSFVFGVDIAWYWWAVGGCLIAFTLSILGIRLSMRIDLVLAIIADTVLLAVAVAIIVSVIGKGGFTLEPFVPTYAPTEFTGLSLAIAFGVLIFLGFEQSFTLGEEVRDVHGDVPKAIYVSLAAIGLLLLISTYAMVLGFGAIHMDQLSDAFAKDGTPFWRLTEIHLSTPWRDALQLVAITSILGNLIASHNCVVRIEYGMGRAGAFPRIFGRTSTQFRTPYVAILVQTGLSILVVAAIAIFWTPVAAFGFIGFAVGLAASISFIAIMAAAIRFFRRTRPQDSAWFNYVIPAVGIVLLLPAVYTSFYPNPGPPLSYAPWALVAWLVIGAILLIWREQRRQPIDIDYAFKDLGEPMPPEPAAQR